MGVCGDEGMRNTQEHSETHLLVFHALCLFPHQFRCERLPRVVGAAGDKLDGFAHRLSEGHGDGRQSCGKARAKYMSVKRQSDD